MDVLSRLDLYAIGRQFIIDHAKKIDPSIIDVDGSDAQIFIGSVSVVAAALSNQLAYGINSQTLDGSEDEEVDRYAFDRYQLTRMGATPALGSVRIFRPNFAAGLGTVFAGTSITSLSGAQYVTTTDAVFGPTSLTAGADVRAAQAGKAAQAGRNALTKFSQGATLFDPTLEVTNDQPTAGGEDPEDDETFKNRIRNFWSTARRGILAAISFGALSVPGVVSANAIEAISPVTAAPARIVNLYIADSSGVASVALARQVVVALNDFRAAGIQVIVSNSIPQIVSISLALSFQAGVDTTTITGQIVAAIVSYVNNLPVNGTLFLSGLYAVLNQFVSDGLVAGQSSIVSPSGDLVPAIGSTLRTTTANVSTAGA